MSDLAAKKEAARMRARAARAGDTARGVGLTLTPAAAEYIRTQSAADDPVVVIRVTAGGCAGLEWHVDLGDPASTCGDDERESVQHGIRVRQDLRSSLHLAGATLDFAGDMFTRGFRLQTPQGTARCSCGASLGA